MRHGDVNDIDLVAGKQFGVVARAELHGGHLAKPLEQVLAQIAHGGELRAHGEILQRKPPPKARSRLAPH